MNRFNKLVIICIALCTLIFCLLCAISARNEKIAKENKDKVIFIENNSIGCSKYSLNGDIFWKCPKQIDIQQIESRYCSGYGIHRNCRTEQEPVI